MKKIYGFAALSAAMLLASCSNNDEPIPGGGQSTNFGKEHIGYIALSLNAPLDETRADYKHTYSLGSTAESKILGGCVICFNSSNEMVDFTDLTEANFTSNGNAGDNKNIESYKQMEIQVREWENNKVAKMITVLNMVGGPTQTGNDTPKLRGLGLEHPTVDEDTKTVTYADGKRPSVDDVRKMLQDFATTTDLTEGHFIMSTAVCNATTPTYTTPVVAYSDFAEATSHHVDVYVERVVAKTAYTVKKDGANPAFNNAGATDLNLDGKDYATTNTDESLRKLNIVVTGIEYANVADKGYLVKDISSVPTTGWTTSPETFKWDEYDSDASKNKHRSHWATVAELAPAGTTSSTTQLVLRNNSWNTITSGGAGFLSSTATVSKYMLENTNQTQPTCILITAYVDAGKKSDNVTQKDIYRSVVNGKYYTEDNILKAYEGYIANEKYLKKVEGKNEYTQLTWEDFEIIPSTSSVVPNTCPKDDYSGYIQIKSTVGKIYTNTGDPATIAATEKTYSEVNQDLLKKTVNSKTTETNEDGSVKKDSNDKEVYVQLYKYRVYKWEGGKCYYYKNIQPDVVGLPGVVRNHYYDLTLNGVKGMGVPVFNPATVIVPETPDPVDPDEPTDVFINATIHVLSWTYYTQGISFE